jgi:hypothetical protein
MGKNYSKKQLQKLRELRNTSPKFSCTKCNNSMYVEGLLCSSCHSKEQQGAIDNSKTNLNRIVEIFK